MQQQVIDKIEQLKQQGFVVREKVVAGETCYLVFPSKLGIDWTRENLVYRSSIWTSGMLPVSLGFKKFFNYGEAQEVVPDFTDKELNDNTAHVIEKIDGSCLIVSRFRGELIVRTRGTFDAREHEKTKDEIDELQKRYPKAFSNPNLDSEKYTYIYEWTTRANRIVVDYGAQADIKLIGIVEHATYSYFPQHDLAEASLEIEVYVPNCKRIGSKVELLEAIGSMTHAEGYCVYYNNDQDIKKVKCEWYLERHRLRSYCTLDNLLDTYMSLGFPQSEAFVKHMREYLDFECMPEAEELIKKILEASKNADIYYMDLLDYANTLPSDKTKEARKHAAERIRIERAEESGLIFTLLDGRELDKKQRKKLIEKYL